MRTLRPIRTAVLLAAINAASPASAWEFTRDDAGAPVRWPATSVRVFVEDEVDLAAAASHAVEEWGAASHGRLALTLSERSDRAHVVVRWAAEWPYAEDLLALTAIEHVAGAIRSATIDVNPGLRSPTHGFDLAAVVTHELGHALGLAHEHAVLEATMAPTLRPGDADRRYLHEDDVEGIRALYPESDLGPRQCSAAPAPAGSLWLGLLLVGALRRRAGRAGA